MVAAMTIVYHRLAAFEGCTVTALVCGWLGGCSRNEVSATLSLQLWICAVC